MSPVWGCWAWAGLPSSPPPPHCGVPQRGVHAGPFISDRDIRALPMGPRDAEGLHPAPWQGSGLSTHPGPSRAPAPLQQRVRFGVCGCRCGQGTGMGPDPADGCPSVLPGITPLPSPPMGAHPPCLGITLRSVGSSKGPWGQACVSVPGQAAALPVGHPDPVPIPKPPTGNRGVSEPHSGFAFSGAFP